jgi:hypothetical protein
LIVGGNTINATPVTQPVEGSGDWYTYIATYTANAGDAGQPITISLSGTTQGDFDGVTLSSSAVPEPSTWAMMLLGFAAWASPAIGRRGARGLTRRPDSVPSRAL